MYKDLKLSDRARVIEMAVKSGITDLSTIEEVYNTFAKGGDLEEPAERRKVGDHYLTLEQYKEFQRDAIRQAAIQKAITRKEGVFPVINGEVGKSCIYTATDNFGRKYRVAGNQTFFANPEKYGFAVNGPVENARPGDLYQLFNNKGVPDHMNMITGEDANHNLLVSYSSGYAGFPNMSRGDYKVNAPMFDKAGYETYRFIGTPDDNAAWEEQYNQYQAAPIPVEVPKVLNNRVITTGYANGGHMYGPGGDKSISLPQMIAATRSWLSNPENKKKAAFRLGAAAKQGAGLSPLQIVMALGKENPEYDELEAYLYGPERFYTQYKGVSKGPLTDEKYQNIPQYMAELNPRGEYVIPKDMKQLVLDAAKSGTNIYINADNLYDPGSVRFDAANHPVKFRYKNGKLVADAADLYDFDEGYVDRYSEKKNPIKKAILRKEIKEMQSVGTPYIVRQDGIPVRFAGDGPSEDPWVDDIEAENFEEAFKRGETGKGYNWKGAIENVKNRMAAPEGNIKKDGGKIHIKPESGRLYGMGGPEGDGIYLGELQPSTVKPEPVKIVLRTDGISKDTPITHSTLVGPGMLVSKGMDDPTYNLLTANCSDATGEILSSIAGKELTDGITTPYGLARKVSAEFGSYPNYMERFNGLDAIQSFEVPWYDYRVARDIATKKRAELVDYELKKAGVSDEKRKAAVESVYNSSPLLPYRLNDYASGGRIYIKPENRGKFTALKKRTGHSASWFKAHGTPAQKKMAVFALNARKWKHEDGGLMTKL